MIDSTNFFMEFKGILGENIPEDIEVLFTSAWDVLISQEYKDCFPNLAPKFDGDKKWHNILSNNFNDLRRALGQCFYHYHNLCTIEDVAIQLIKKHKPVQGKNNCMALSCEKMDYEFHASIFSIKLFITYLSRFTFTYFKNEAHSFSKYDKVLSKYKDDKAKKLLSFLDESWSELSLFYSIGDRKSVRDTLAHFSFIGAGWINIYELNDEAIAGIAIPDVVIDNERLKPEFAPEQVNELGLGTARIISVQLTYLVSFANEIFKIFGLAS